MKTLTKRASSSSSCPPAARRAPTRSRRTPRPRLAAPARGRARGARPLRVAAQAPSAAARERACAACRRAARRRAQGDAASVASSSDLPPPSSALPKLPSPSSWRFQPTSARSHISRPTGALAPEFRKRPRRPHHRIETRARGVVLLVVGTLLASVSPLCVDDRRTHARPLARVRAAPFLDRPGPEARARPAGARRPTCSACRSP